MDYKVIRSARRTVTLQIKRGEVIVRAPNRMSERDIERFVKSHSMWIEKNLAEYANRMQNFENVPPLTEQELQELKKRAKLIFEQRAAHYAPLLGVTYSTITVRAQRTRWGSCSAKGNLSFNCLLMLLPNEVVDSVVVHELCHRKHMNHSPLFYAEIERVFPEYRKCSKWLKENGGMTRQMIYHGDDGWRLEK
jgi:predicted metal-dependent hydrolase